MVGVAAPELGGAAASAGAPARQCQSPTDTQASSFVKSKRTCAQNIKHYLPHLTLCSSFALLISAIVTGLVLTPSLVHTIVGSQAVIKPSMKFYKEWKNHGDSTANISLIYHMWNVTNSEEVMKGAKPRVEPVGPFVYTQRNYKDNVTFSDDGNEVFYTYTQQMHFDRERSAFSEDTVIIMPNLAIFAAIYRCSKAGRFCAVPGFCPSMLPYQPAAGAALNTFGLNWEANSMHREMVGYTVREWLWGFQDPFVTTLQGSAQKLHMPIKTQEWVSLQFNDTPDMWNHTTAQYTGKHDHHQSGALFQWAGCPNLGTPLGTNDTTNKTARVDYSACAARTSPSAADNDGSVGPLMQWYGGGQPDCGKFTHEDCPADGCSFDAVTMKCLPKPQSASKVEGTDAYQQYPHLKDDDQPFIFLDQAFRKFKLHHTAKETFHGVDVGRWEFHPDTFKATPEVPANEENLQFVDGLMNLTRAQAAPIYVSKPLFKDSTANLADYVDIPESAKFLDKPTYFLFEPWTGMGMAADINLQMNLEVEDMGPLWGEGFARGNDAAGCPGCTQENCTDGKGKPQSGCWPFPPNTTDKRPFSQGLKKAYYPLVHINQHVFMHDQTITDLKHKALLLINLGQGMHFYGAPIFLALGLTQFLFGGFLLWKRRQVETEFARCKEKVAEYERLLGEDAQPKALVA